MKMKLLIAALLVLLLPAGVLVAQEDEDAGRVVSDFVGDDVTLLNDDLTVTETGQISGDVALFNGDAVVFGTINGDLIVLNGNIVVEDTAVIRGDCVAFNGSVSGNSTDCFEFDGSGFPLANQFGGEEFPPIPPPGEFVVETSGSPFGTIFGSLGLSLVMGMLAAIVYKVAPSSTQRIENAMRDEPGATIVVGLLSFVAIPFVNLILLILSSLLLIVCVGLLGFPIIFALTAGFVAAGAWSTVLWGKRFGQRIADRMDRDGESVRVVALGTMAVAFVWGLLFFANPLTAFLVILITVVPLAWGMGATALTRFGTRPFPYQEPVVLLEPEPSADKITAVLDTLDE